MKRKYSGEKERSDLPSTGKSELLHGRGSFVNLARSDTTGANVDAAGPAVFRRYANTLYIGFENPLRLVVGMADIVAGHARFSTDTARCH